MIANGECKFLPLSLRLIIVRFTLFFKKTSRFVKEVLFYPKNEVMQRCQPLEISNLKIFSDQYPPLTEFNRATAPSKKIFFNGNLPSPSNFAEKRGFICQGVQLVEYSSIQILAYIGVTKKKLSTFCLHKRASRKKMRPETIIQA